MRDEQIANVYVFMQNLLKLYKCHKMHVMWKIYGIFKANYS